MKPCLHTNTSWCSVQNVHEKRHNSIHKKRRVPHKTAIFHNPPTPSFTGDRRKLDRSLTDEHLSTSCFYENIRRKFFCGYNILTEGVSATWMYSNAAIWVWRLVWVKTNRCFMSGVCGFHELRFILWFSGVKTQTTAAGEETRTSKKNYS